MVNLANLGEYVRTRRIVRGLTQRQLAEKCEVVQGTISRLEHGALSKIDSVLINKLASALGTTPEYLSGKAKDVDLNHLVRSDLNANYLFNIYQELSQEQANQVVQFAEFIRWRGTSYKKLVDGFAGLYRSYNNLVEKGVADESDPGFEEAQILRGEMLINRAMEEVLREKNGDSSQNKKGPQQE